MKPSDFVFNTLPANVEAERAILGAILLDSALYNEAAGVLNDADFSLDSHRRIYRGMTRLATALKPVDMVTLVEELNHSRDLGPIGDVSYLTSLIEGLPDRPSIAHYAASVKEKAQLRALLCAASSTMDSITGGAPLSTVSTSLMEAILQVESVSAPTKIVTPHDFMPDVLASLQAQSSAKGVIGLPTGVDCLDHAIGGLRSGELIVVGARPGAGKTALMAQMAYANCAADTPVGMFSLEMSREDLGRRFISMVSSISASKVRDPRFIAKDEWRTVAAAAAEVSAWPLYVDDSGSMSISEMVARAKLLIAREGVKLILVDYLQLVRAPITDIRERVGYVADQLRILAKMEKVPIVLLSQLKRPMRVNDEPTMNDLRESGDIEAHAHVVALIQSPVGPDGRPTNQQKFILGKNRNGLRGYQEVMMSETKLMFYERTS